MPSPDPPKAPDGRYLIVDGQLWRAANPQLSANKKETLVAELMAACRAVYAAAQASNKGAEHLARARVNKAKTALGERGAPWWDDGAPDYNRRRAENTPYAEWYARRQH